MKKRLVFVIFIIMTALSATSFLFYENSVRKCIGTEEYVTEEGLAYKEVWNGEKDIVLEAKGHFGRILVKGLGNAGNFTGKTVKISGKIRRPEPERNPGGYSEVAFFAGKGIYYVISADEISDTGRKTFGIRAIGSFMRQGIVDSITELLGEDKGFTLAVMTGDSSALEKDEKAYVRMSGISHLFAVSGMHVGYVLMPFRKGVKRRFLKTAARSFICMLPLLVFAVLTGMSPSVIRAATAAAYGLIAKAVKRKPDPFNAVGIGGILCILIYPFAAADTGFLLSFGAVLSAMLIVPILKKYIKKESKIFDALSFGIAANIGLLPLMIFKYGTVAPAGILITVIAAPLSAVLCVAGYSMALLNMIPYLSYAGKLISYGLITVTRLISKVAETGALIPNIRIPTYAWAVIVAVMLILLLLYLKPDFLKKAVMLSAAAGLITFFVTEAGYASRAKIIWYDVGQGSCSFIQTSGGKRILIDGGPGFTDVSDLLLKSGCDRLDAVILSHGDKDHCEGLFTVIEKNDVSLLIVPDNPNDENAALLAKKAEEKGIRVVRQSRSGTYRADEENTFSIYYERDASSLNNSSLVVQLDTNEGSVLFPGDIEISGEKKLAESNLTGKCLILTASHHGSKGATGNLLLEKTNPLFAVISVGKNNFYGHPNKETLERFEKAGIRILRTDLEGAVTAKLKPDGIGVTTWLTKKNLVIKTYWEE